MIIGVDPGTVTGVVVYEPYIKQFTVHANMTALDAVVLVWSYVDAASTYVGDPISVVCERYDITSGTTRAARNRDPYHVEGAVKLRCEMQYVNFHQVSRADAKRFATDARLKHLGCYWSGLGHDRDAARQVITHLARVDPQFRRQLVDRGEG